MFEDIIIKKFFTESLHLDIVEYCKNDSKLYPFQLDNVYMYKKNLDFFNQIHYQINSYFSNLVNNRLRPGDNYFQLLYDLRKDIYQRPFDIGQYIFTYVIECPAYISVIDNVDIRSNQGILYQDNKKFTVNDNNLCSSIVSFTFTLE